MAGQFTHLCGDSQCGCGQCGQIVAVAVGVVSAYGEAPFCVLCPQVSANWRVQRSYCHHGLEGQTVGV